MNLAFFFYKKDPSIYNFYLDTNPSVRIQMSQFEVSNDIYRPQTKLRAR